MLRPDSPPPPARDVAVDGDQFTPMEMYQHVSVVIRVTVHAAQKQHCETIIPGGNKVPVCSVGNFEFFHSLGANSVGYLFQFQV